MTLQGAAQELRISTATLKNWVKSGLVSRLYPSKGSSHLFWGGDIFDSKQIMQLKRQIKSGSLDRLQKRANKNFNFQKNHHRELLDQLTDDYNSIIRTYEERVEKDPKELKKILFSVYLVLLEAQKLLKFQEKKYISRSKLKRISARKSRSVSITESKNKAKCRLKCEIEHEIKYVMNSELKCVSKKLKQELDQWQIDFKDSSLSADLAYLRTQFLKLRTQTAAAQDAVLSFVYQSLRGIGDKQRTGAYYTPDRLTQIIVDQALKGFLLRKAKDVTFLDPCCGSGSFLLAAYRRLQSSSLVPNPERNVFGIDSDPLAVLLARARLTLATHGKAQSEQQIILGDSLLRNFLLINKDSTIPFADCICTNPPWGAYFSHAMKRSLNHIFSEIKSGESFSYFLMASMNFLLKPNGVLTFILPEAFLHVQKHRDIRQIVQDRFEILDLQILEEKFSGVFTKAISIMLNNRQPQGKQLLSSAQQSGSSKISNAICTMMDQKRSITLKNNAHWGLGIVTGNNRKFLSHQCRKGYERILKGKDILRFRTNFQNAPQYLRFNNKALQQVAPEELYRAREKLVYRFICKELVFVIDRTGSLTLNSANILIPKIPGYSLPVVCGILNSKLAQLYYQNRFHSIKILRSHLEQFPFPFPFSKRKSHCKIQIETLVLKLESAKGKNFITLYDQLNESVMDWYGIPFSLRKGVHDFPISKSFLNTNISI